MSSDIVAVILAGGFGTRVQHLLGELPKPMAPIAGKPCLEWLARYLVAQGIRRMVISSGYRAEVIERHFAASPIPDVHIQCVAEPCPLGTGGGFLHAVHESGQSAGAWLVLNGDTFAFAHLAEAMAALDDAKADGVIFGREVPDASRYGSLIADAVGNLLRFEEKRPGKGLISTGVYLFRDSLVKKFPAQRAVEISPASGAPATVGTPQRPKLPLPPALSPSDPESGKSLSGLNSGVAPLSLERDVFPALTSSGALIKVLRMEAPFLDIGTPESLTAADAFVRENRAWFDLPAV